MFHCVHFILQEPEAIQDVEDGAETQRGIGIMVVVSLAVATFMVS